MEFSTLRLSRQSARTGAYYDILGATAAEAVENALRDIGNRQLMDLYLKGAE